MDMTPRRIVEMAVRKGLNMIAISDHNSAENIETTVKIAQNKGITVLPSMEITSYEESHILAIFDSVDKAMDIQKIVYRHLPDNINDERLTGYQLVVNENDEVVRFNTMPFLSAVNISVKKLVSVIHSLGGLAVASHIDREAFSIVSQIGFIPDDIEFDAIEISHNTKLDRAKLLFEEYAHIPWITSSDAHRLDDIGCRTTSFFLKEATFEEIAAAFKGDRRIEWC
jgi:PHP family Zn ribbon phosphoesterase